MAWTTPVTAVVNSTFTASQWNAGVRDNLAITAPAISTTEGWLIVTNGANQVVQREVAQDEISTSESTTSTIYTDLATTGPQVFSLETGLRALVYIACSIQNSATSTSAAAVNITGATTLAPTDNSAILFDGGSGKSDRIGVTYGHMSLNAGSNTFTMRYKVTSAATTGVFQRRRMVVMAL